MEEKNALVISPHPDDMEIGMGGTVARLIDAGVNVISFVVTDGRRSTSVYGLSEEEMVQVRESEAREAVGILGIDFLILLGLDDVKSGGSQEKFKNELKAAFARFKPGEVYMPHPEIDKHPTHRTVSQMVLETMKEIPPGELSKGFKLWCYEVWTPFPNYDRIEDISLQMHMKNAAIEAHRSQVEYKNYTEGISGLNRYRAVFNETSGVTIMDYAEVFIEIKL
ncbi:MAG: PIG-L deacetylase family protein [Deltaproteobacteria bacterium]